MSSVKPGSSDDRLIWETWLAQYRLPVLTVADEVGIFARLSPTPMLTEQLANELALDARALQIHLGALAAMGFLERRESRWRATASARAWMDSSSADYCGPALHVFRQSQPLHAQLLSTLKTGDRAAGHASAVDEWERGELPRELAARITAYMNAHSRAGARALARETDFARVRNLLDVGGGSAIYSIELARAWPGLRATVMDIGTICDEAQTYITAAKSGGQVDTLALNMFTQDWPRDRDAHLFSNIFHDWSDATCELLAAKSFAALPRGGIILLHEMLMDDDGCGPYAAAAFSLLMLLGTKGRQYSLPELRAFLQHAGFVDVEARSVGSGYYSLVTAHKP